MPTSSLLNGDFRRAHHRILFVIARHSGITVGDLGIRLAISKQSMHRTLKQLLDDGYATFQRDPSQHRFKALHLTKAGTELEKTAIELEPEIMKEAFTKAGAHSASRVDFLLGSRGLNTMDQYEPK